MDVRGGSHLPSNGAMSSQSHGSAGNGRALLEWVLESVPRDQSGVEFAEVLSDVHEKHPSFPREDIRSAMWKLLAAGDLGLTTSSRVTRG